MRLYLISGISLLTPVLVLAAPDTISLSLQQRNVAAQTTAQSAAACTAIQPFYWEIGDAARQLAGASVGINPPARGTQMMIASASKWIYAGYVAEQRHDKLTDEDVRFLSFRSGYTKFRMCRASQTVAACQGSFLNGRGEPDSATANRFDYSGGHMQKHATIMGLGNLDNDGLAAEIRYGLRPLGADWRFSYKQPQLAGGGVTSAADYARFLQAALAGNLKIAKLLGTHAVCTNPKTCPDEAIKTPIPHEETWHYSIGHWVEDDPKIGDGAFSSPGAFGFYPWIDRSKQYYGIVARDARRGALSRDQSERPGVESVSCGRLIRAAWMDGQARQ